MAITRDDIKIKAPERLTDFEDGGGFMTGNEIVDGQLNNVFDSIDRINRTAGNVSLRVIYPHVDADNVDKYLGAHAALIDGPEDPAVSLTLFDYGEEGTERAAAKNHLESYFAMDTPFGWFALGNQLEGSRALILFAVPGSYVVPELGELLVVTREDFATQDVIVQQFSRVDSVELETGLTWSDEKGPFQYDRLTIEIQDPLTQSFAGFPEPERAPSYTSTNPITVVRATRVANAARYSGRAALAEAGATNDTALSMETIFSQLVPANTQESPITDAVPGGVVTAAVPASESAVTDSASISATSGTPRTVYARQGIKPGSLTLTWQGQTWTDNGDGTLLRGGLAAGTVDYPAGRAGFIPHSTSTGTVSLDYMPAARITENAQTRAIYIDEQNRGFNHTLTLRPIPAPGALSISYRTLGKWYTITDNGKGELTSDGAGVGSLNFSTGTALVTLAREPDVGTMIIYSWGTPAHYDIRDTDAAGVAPETVIQTGEPIAASTLSVSWSDGSTTLTATDDGDGNLSGDATGRVLYSAGEIRIIPDALPEPGANFEATYDRATAQDESVSASLSGNNLEFTLDLEPEPGSVEFTTTENVAGFGNFVIAWRDDGAGGMVGTILSSPGGERPPAMNPGELTGTINYATRAVSVKAQGSNRVTTYEYGYA